MFGVLGNITWHLVPVPDQDVILLFKLCVCEGCNLANSTLQGVNSSMGGWSRLLTSTVFICPVSKAEELRQEVLRKVAQQRSQCEMAVEAKARLLSASLATGIPEPQRNKHQLWEKEAKEFARKEQGWGIIDLYVHNSVYYFFYHMITIW